MVTEQEARDMFAAIGSFQTIDRQTAATQHQADLTVARQWFRANITILWRATQTTRQQLNNSFIDQDTLMALRHTPIRMVVIRETLDTVRQRIRTLKANL